MTPPSSASASDRSRPAALGLSLAAWLALGTSCCPTLPEAATGGTEVDHAGATHEPTGHGTEGDDAGATPARSAEPPQRFEPSRAAIDSPAEAKLAWCAPTEQPPAEAGAPTAAPERAGAERPAPTAPSPIAAVRVAVRPVALPTPRVEVEVRIRATAELLSWSMGRPPAGEPLGIAVVDSQGAVPHKLACDDRWCRLTLARSAAGTVAVRYSVHPTEEQSGEPSGLVVAPDHSYLGADALVLLPTALDEVPVSATVVLDPSGVGADGVASSIGVGACRQKRLLGRALRRIGMLAGPLGTAVMDSAEGHDEAAWHGYTAFDPRSFAAEIAETRTAMRQFFGERTDSPATLLLVAHPRARGSVRVAYRAPSVIGFVGIEERWAAPLRLAFAQQLLHHWIGGQLWVGPTDPTHEAESDWFTEGLARHYARELLFRFGQLSVEEVRDEVDALLAVQASSPLGGLGNAELAARSAEPDARRLMVARGALYAARVDGLLLRSTRGARSLDAVVAALLAQARSRAGALPVSAWLETVAIDLGADAGAEFERLIGAGERIDLPLEAVGRCFRQATHPYAVFGLGFDLAATRASADQRLVGLEPQGPARRVGARPTDVLESITFAEGRTDLPVELTVGRDGHSRLLRYAPIARTVRLQGFDVVAAASRMKCAR